MSIREHKDRSAFGRENHRRDVAAMERDRAKVESVSDPLCDCGWITAMEFCPMCGGRTR